MTLEQGAGSRSHFTDAAFVAASAGIALTLGVVANKVYAVVLGPTGLGGVSLALAVLTVGALSVSVGAGNSLAQVMNAESANGGQIAQTLTRIARRYAAAIAAAAALLIVVLAEPLAIIAFGTEARARYIVLLAPAVALTALAYVEVGVLGGLRRPRAIGLVHAFAAVCGAVFGAIGVAFAGLDGYVASVPLTGLAHYLFARIQADRVLAPIPRDGRKPRARAMARVLRLGVAAAAGQLVGVSASLVVPILVLHGVGDAEVGLYRAAIAISFGYLTVIMATLSYEFVPRLAREESAELSARIDQQLRLILGVALPTLLVLYALAPIVIRLLYSANFDSTVSLLQWLVTGDLLRIAGWGISYSLFARGYGRSHGMLEVGCGILVVISMGVGMAIIGFDGLGPGYAAAQTLYYTLAWVVAIKGGLTVPGRLQAVVLLMTVACAVALLVSVPPVTMSIVFSALAFALAVMAIPRLRRLVSS